MSDKALIQHNYFRQSRTRFCELVDTGQWSWESLRERPSVVPNALLALNNLGCSHPHGKQLLCEPKASTRTSPNVRVASKGTVNCSGFLTDVDRM